MRLTREQMLKVEKRKFKDLEVPELGGDVRIASLSAGAALRLRELGIETGIATSGGYREMAITLFSSSIVDEKGHAEFDETSATEFLGRISTDTMSLIINEIMKLSGKEKPKVVVVAEDEAAATANPSIAAQSVASPSV